MLINLVNGFGMPGDASGVMVQDLDYASVVSYQKRAH